MSVRNGEGILTKEETEAVKELADNAKKPDKAVMINGAECIPVTQEEFLGRLPAKNVPTQDIPAKSISYGGIADAIKNTAPDLSGIIRAGMPEVPSVTRNNNNINNVVNIDTLSLPNVQDYKSFKNDIFRDMQRSSNYKGFIKDIIGGGMKGHREPVFRPYM